MSYLEELLPEFRKGAKIRRRKWIPNSYIYKDGSSGFVFTDENEQYNFTHEDIVLGEWELYQEPEPDWDYIIKNKCLCWFWDYEEESKVMDILYKFNDKSRFKFVRKNGEDEYPYINCRPLNRDEATFYEDRKDE